MFLYGVSRLTIYMCYVYVLFFFFCMSAIAHCSSECTHRNFPIHNTNILPWPHNQDSHLIDCISHVLPEKYDTFVAQTWNRAGLYLISHNVRYSHCNLMRECHQSRTDCVPSQAVIRASSKSAQSLVLHSARQKEKLWFSATSFDEEVKMILRDKDLKKMKTACFYARAKHFLVFLAFFFLFFSAASVTGSQPK